MTAFNGSMTEANLRLAFATAALAARRYVALADRAEAEGRDDAAAVFRAVARSRACQAEAHLLRLEPCDDSFGTAYHVRLAILDALGACADLYPGMARSARDEGFGSIADWFEMRAKASRSHAGRFRTVLKAML